MNVLLASGNQTVAERWRGLLDGRNRVEQVNTVSLLLEALGAKQYDIVILHRLLVDLPTFTDIRRAIPSARFFLLSDLPGEEEGLAFLKLGIVGYGNTYISPPRFAEALHVIADGGVWLGQQVIRQLIIESYAQSSGTSPGSSNPRLSVLTRMERNVAELIAQGRTNLEIAAELDITERTVKAHLTAIYSKLHVANRLSLALLINQAK